MCRDCLVAGVTEFAEWAEVAEAEQAVRKKEIETGRSIPGAVRGLFDHELKAEVRFAEIDDLEKEMAAEAADEIEAIQTVVGVTVMAALFGTRTSLSPALIAERIAAIDASGWPENVRDRILLGRERLAAIMSTAYARSSAILIGEAVRQGRKRGPVPLTRDPSDFVPLATSAAVEPWQRTLLVVHNEHLSPIGILKGTVAREAVRNTIASTGTAGAVDKARQGILSAAGAGRVETGQRLNPTASFASELLDGATCGPCGDIDGTEYETMDEARADYPTGAYRLCSGGARCRGTLVFRFE